MLLLNNTHIVNSLHCFFIKIIFSTYMWNEYNDIVTKCCIKCIILNKLFLNDIFFKNIFSADIWNMCFYCKLFYPTLGLNLGGFYYEFIFLLVKNEGKI